MIIRPAVYKAFTCTVDASKNEARIEVSYSLEGVFTDGLVGLISHDQLAPYASYNVFKIDG